MIVPKFAIVYYEGDTTYLEKGDFVPDPKKKGEYVLEGMRPFVSDELLKLQTVTMNGKGIFVDGMLPKGTVLLNQFPSNAMIAWIEPACKRKILFKDESLTGIYDVPNTLFFIHNSDLYAFLVKNRDMEKFTMDTQLYRSHYYNVWDSCIVCVGTGYKPNVDSVGVNELVERVSHNFWEGSYFTHSSVSGIDEIWTEKKGRYPETKWKKITTLRELVSKFMSL